MKTIKYFITALSIGTIINSCSSDLNTLPNGDISGEQLNDDKTKAEKILGGIYLDRAVMEPEELLCIPILVLWP